MNRLKNGTIATGAPGSAARKAAEIEDATLEPFLIIERITDCLLEFYRRDEINFSCGRHDSAASTQCNQYLDQGECRHTRARKILKLLKYEI